MLACPPIDARRPYTRNEPVVDYREINSVFIHPEYDSSTYRYDVLMYRLTEEITDRGTARLPARDQVVPAGTPALTMGWGTTSFEGPTSNVLRQVELNTLSNQQCRSDYPQLHTPSQKCAFAPGRDSCQGDSGGPLLESNTLVQIGIVSSGRGCGEFPGIYTNLAMPQILDWVQQVVDGRISPASTSWSRMQNWKSILVFMCMFIPLLLGV